MYYDVRMHVLVKSVKLLFQCFVYSNGIVMILMMIMINIDDHDNILTVYSV